MPLLNSGIGNYVNYAGKRYSYFAGNNYLGLANNHEVKQASIKAIRKYGVNFSASRRTTGTADIHLELEKELSIFKGKQDSVVFASGYQGNGILLEILKNRYSVVFTDQFAHPSITRSIPREISNIHYYNHCDPEHLGYLLEKNKGLQPLIITDGIFALTGEIAPLDKIYSLAEEHHGILVVDDAHSTGILGKTGRGTPEHFNLPEAENIYQTETMSKALGGYGGFIAGSSILTGLIRETSATYQASTALPPPIVAVGIASLKIIQENPELRIRLLEKTGELRKQISLLGFQTTKYNTPIIPIMLSASEKAKDLSLFLERNRIIAPFIQYPVNQEKFIVRITVSVNHTDEQTDGLLRMLKKWKEKNGKN
jgi:7-keto-8-aminopelargonate synthetase-like enzyme